MNKIRLQLHFILFSYWKFFIKFILKVFNKMSKTCTNFKSLSEISNQVKKNQASKM